MDDREAAFLSVRVRDERDLDTRKAGMECESRQGLVPEGTEDLPRRRSLSVLLLRAETRFGVR
jgi:hypothetical protein